MNFAPFSKLLFIAIIATLFAACRNNAANEANLFEKTGVPSIDKATDMLQANPEKDTLWALRGVAFYKEEMYDKAMRDFKKAIALDSNKIDYYHALADAQLDFNQSKEALKTLELALKKKPNRIPTMLKLSEFQLIMKQYGQSEGTCNKILAIDDNNPEANFMLGRVFKEMTDTIRAVEHFQRAVEQEPDHYDSYIQLGLLLSNKKSDIALRYFDNALRIDSTSTEAMYGKAMFFQSLKIPNFEAAQKLYRKIIAIDPQHVDAIFNTGILNMLQKKPAEAEKSFAMSIEIDPQCAKCFYYKGVMEAARNDQKTANASYQNALNIDPDYEEAKKALGK